MAKIKPRGAGGPTEAITAVPMYVSVWVMVNHDGLSLTEVGRRLGIHRNTVRAMLAKYKSRLESGEVAHDASSAEEEEKRFKRVAVLQSQMSLLIHTNPKNAGKKAYDNAQSSRFVLQSTGVMVPKSGVDMALSMTVEEQVKAQTDNLRKMLSGNKKDAE
jgi:hypothetical protein